MGPLMREHNIPGMAVAITLRGKPYYFNYGLASVEEATPVTRNTLFELGSVSKTFTATLGAHALVQGKLSLADPVSKHIPTLAGTAFDSITLLHLATYTAGGLPLQFPDDVTPDSMMGYYQAWRPSFSAGSHRLYSNPSIGLFGYAAATSLGAPFEQVMKTDILKPLGMTHTYITVPAAAMRHYAFGYSKANKPVRVNPGVLDAQAYGVKSTSHDMLRFVQAQLASEVNSPAGGKPYPLQRAMSATHQGYFKVADMGQGLGWEMYAYPLTLDTLLDGNSSGMALEARAATAVNPPQDARPSMLFNKTGSTNGFGAYVVFIPSKAIGIVMLANRNYPNPARVKAAMEVIEKLLAADKR